MKRPNIYQFVGQNDVSASQPTVYVCHSFPAKKQTPSDFMAAVIIHMGFKGSDDEICPALTFSPSICHEGWGWIP